MKLAWEPFFTWNALSFGLLDGSSTAYLLPLLVSLGYFYFSVLGRTGLGAVEYFNYGIEYPLVRDHMRGIIDSRN